MSTNLLAASNQWATRPADERFWSLRDLQSTLKDTRERSYERDSTVKAVKAIAFDTPNGKDLGLATNNLPVRLTHYSFNQLSQFADAPASYLRTLQPDLAASCLNAGLGKYADSAAKLLLCRNGQKGAGDFTLRSITTDHYSRLWNSDIVNDLAPALEKGWMTPPARPAMHDPRARPATLADIVPNQDNFGLAVKVGDMIAPAGVYAGDRDMFIFLVHPDRVIDDGVKGLMRGVFVWNSEVGAGAFKVQAFYLENVCGNHIVWGAKNVRTFRLVHKGKDQFRNIGYKLKKQLVDYANRSTDEEERMIKAARSYSLGKNQEEVMETVYNNKQLGLSQKVIEATYTVAEKWEHTAKSAPTTAWGFVHGLTRYSQLTQNADERNKLDAAGGKLLQLAYASKS